MKNKIINSFCKSDKRESYLCDKDNHLNICNIFFYRYIKV